MWFAFVLVLRLVYRYLFGVGGFLFCVDLLYFACLRGWFVWVLIWCVDFGDLV